jgi:predicted XRE-type DNA-binding protein
VNLYEKAIHEAWRKQAEGVEAWNGKRLIDVCPSFETLSKLAGRPQAMTIERVIVRFFAKVKMPSGGFGCWIWTAKKNAGGYGLFTLNNRSTLAHRVSFLLFFGREIAKNSESINDMYLMHKCDTPPCVNPWHLDLGDAEENNADMRRKGRARFVGGLGKNFGENNGRVKLKREEVIKIRELLTEGELSQRRIGELFNVSKGAISSINTNLNWRKV